MDDIGMLIALSRRHVWNAASKKLESEGYSMLSWALLACLSKIGPATQRDIAAAIGQHPAGVSRLIDEMEEQGFVRRRRDATDRRRARIEVAAKGEAMFQEAHPLVLSSLKEALRGLSLAEQRELSRLLRKLLSVDGAVIPEVPRVAARPRPQEARPKAPRPKSPRARV